MAISGVGQSYYQNNVATTKSTKSFHSTLQLPGSFFELNCPAFGSGNQSVQYFEVIYFHPSLINTCKVNDFNRLSGR